MKKGPHFVKDGEAAHFVHCCEVCGEWGAFGRKVALRAAQRDRDPNKAGRWLCFEHWKKFKGGAD